VQPPATADPDPRDVAGQGLVGGHWSQVHPLDGTAGVMEMPSAVNQSSAAPARSLAATAAIVHWRARRTGTDP
jgi:hypothetical protein